MSDILNSSYIVPLGAFVVAIAALGFGAWRKVRETELKHDFELRQREMEHELRMKEKEVELAKLK